MPAKKPAEKPEVKTAVATRKPKSTAVSTMTASDLEKRIAAMVSSVKDSTETSGGKKIVCKEKSFHLNNGSVVDEINAIIVDFTSQNMFYEGRYDEKNPSPPSCFAIGKIIRDMRPSKQVEDPESDTCAKCPNNQFGSDGDGKACKNTRKLAVLLDGFVEGDELQFISVSPTGIKNFDKYVNSLSSRNKVPTMVMTKLSFDPNKTYNSLVFEEVDDLSSSEMQLAFSYLDEAEKQLAEEMDLAKMREAAENRAGPQRRQPPKKRPAGRAR